MCRLLGIVASELTEFGLVLTEAPRCLAKLSQEHRDGWGLAIHNTEPAGPVGADDPPWTLHRGIEPALDDRRFHEVAAGSRGRVLVAHVRQKTVGPTRLENTHPFVRDGWAFAHNGTITGQDLLRSRCSARRLGEITGDTDSELFFAYVLTRFDECGVTRRADPTALLEEMTAELRAARIGAFNFLLSDGETTFAHRCGRSLFLLERGPDDPVRERRSLIPGAEVMTKWTARRRAVFIASEAITDEPWREVPDGTLLRVDRSPTPAVTHGSLQPSRESSSDATSVEGGRLAG
ncbi:MAG: class II glutamine amidotransferase [Labilithrix sp.]|nr:class II glutamine amidotransferase [Labilithrix sp.]